MFALFEDDILFIHMTAGFAAFGSSTSGYGYSPPSCSGKRQNQARRRFLEIIIFQECVYHALMTA